MDGQQTLKWLTDRSNHVVDQMRKDPDQFDLGKQLQQGRGSFGLIPENIRTPIGQAVSYVVPMSDILGASAKGDPVTAGLAANSLMLPVGAAGFVDDFMNRGKKELAQKVMRDRAKNISRAPTGQFASMAKPTETIGQMRARAGLHPSGGTIGQIQQANQLKSLSAYEDAVNSGNWKAAEQISKQFPGDARYAIHKAFMR